MDMLTFVLKAARAFDAECADCMSPNDLRNPSTNSSKMNGQTVQMALSLSPGRNSLVTASQSKASSSIVIPKLETAAGAEASKKKKKTKVVETEGAGAKKMERFDSDSSVVSKSSAEKDILLSNKDAASIKLMFNLTTLKCFVQVRVYFLFILFHSQFLN